eukprot:3516240-Karenia_brevis.AAC.1
MIPLVAGQIFASIKGRACLPRSIGQHKEVPKSHATNSVLRERPGLSKESQPESETWKSKRSQGGKKEKVPEATISDVSEQLGTDGKTISFFPTDQRLRDKERRKAAKENPDG